MKITIASRLKPFSHRLGSACLIPGTCCKIEAFPTLIRLSLPPYQKSFEMEPAAQPYSSPCRSGGSPLFERGFLQLRLGWTGPVRNFTLQQDLEKNCVYLFGEAKEGFYRFRFSPDPEGIELFAEQLPSSGCSINGQLFSRKQKILYPMDFTVAFPALWERLSLGMSKDQDWDLVLRRFDLREILPVLFGLGQKIPHQIKRCAAGTAMLLDDLESFCRAAFSHILVPRLFDDEYQGLAPEGGQNEDASFLLEESYHRIRSLFFRQHGERLELLPDSRFAAGRMTSIQVSGIGLLDLEWTGFRLRRAILRTSSSSTIELALSGGLNSFRVRTSSADRGKRCQADESLDIQAGKTYYFDGFRRSLVRS